jgi:hypothetical protein
MLAIRLTHTDKLLLFALATFAVVCILHTVCGYWIYSLGQPMRSLWGDDAWRPTSPRQLLLLGVFHVVVAAWLQTLTVTAWAIFTRPPGRAWVGVAGVVSNVVQTVILLCFVGLTPLGLTLGAAYVLQIVAFSCWTVESIK